MTIAAVGSVNTSRCVIVHCALLFRARMFAARPLDLVSMDCQSLRIEYEVSVRGIVGIRQPGDCVRNHADLHWVLCLLARRWIRRGSRPRGCRTTLTWREHRRSVQLTGVLMTRFGLTLMPLLLVRPLSPPPPLGSPKGHEAKALRVWRDRRLALFALVEGSTCLARGLPPIGN